MSEQQAALIPFQVFENPFGEIVKGYADLTAALSEGSTQVSKTAEDLGFKGMDKDTKKAKKGFKGMFKSIGLGFLEAATPIGIVIGALSALGFLEPIVATITSLVSILSIGFAPILDIILELIMSLTPLFEGVSAVIEPLAEILSAALMPIIEDLSPLFSALVSVVLTLLPVLLPLIEVVLEVWTAFNPLQPLLETLIPVIVFLAEVITIVLGPMTSLVGWFSDLSTTIVTFVDEMWNELASFFTDMFTNVGDWLSSGLDSIVQWFKDLPGLILDAIVEAFESIDLGELLAEVF